VPRLRRAADGILWGKPPDGVGSGEGGKAITLPTEKDQGKQQTKKEIEGIFFQTFNEPP